MHSDYEVLKIVGMLLAIKIDCPTETTYIVTLRQVRKYAFGKKTIYRKRLQTSDYDITYLGASVCCHRSKLIDKRNRLTIYMIMW